MSTTTTTATSTTRTTTTTYQVVSIWIADGTTVGTTRRPDWTRADAMRHADEMNDSAMDHGFQYCVEEVVTITRVETTRV